MTIVEFARLVADCRRAQKVYFRDRTPGDLSKSKELEKRVDRAVLDILDERPASMFGDED